MPDPINTDCDAYDFQVARAPFDLFCAMCGTGVGPLLDFLLPPQSAAIQFCARCVKRVTDAAQKLGLLESDAPDA